MCMSINGLVKVCNEFPNVRVKAVEDDQYDECYNSGYGSWGADYHQPAIFFGGEGYITLKDLIPYLKRLASGDKFEGYKGDLFSFDGDSIVHFEYDSSCYDDCPLAEFIHPEDITPDIEKYIK